MFVIQLFEVSHWGVVSCHPAINQGIKKPAAKGGEAAGECFRLYTFIHTYYRGEYLLVVGRNYSLVIFMDVGQLGGLSASRSPLF